MTDTMAPDLPKTMRACQWISTAGGLEKNLHAVGDSPLPKTAHALPAGHTLVKVAYAALNPIDYKFAESPGRYLLTKPAVPCLDFAGTVVDTKNSRLKPGDRVHGSTSPPAFGTLAEYIVVGEQSVVVVPEGVDLREAAAAGIAALAAYKSIAPYVKPAHEVFINGGSGGTGTFGIQIAKALGCRVTTSCSGANIELCKSLGADVVHDYQQEDVLKHLRASERFYDHFVDNVFSDRDLYWKCHFFTEPAATFVTPGDSNLGALKDVGLAYALPSALGGGQRRFAFVAAQANVKDFEQIGQWMKEGKVKAVIDQEYELKDAGKAFERLKSHRTKGKLVVKVSEA